MDQERSSDAIGSRIILPFMFPPTFLWLINLGPGFPPAASAFLQHHIKLVYEQDAIHTQ
jgi:hypothetical protein